MSNKGWLRDAGFEPVGSNDWMSPCGRIVVGVTGVTGTRWAVDIDGKTALTANNRPRVFGSAKRAAEFGYVSTAVPLDSMKHYQIVRQGNQLSILEFGDECPLMGDRGSYKPCEGTSLLVVGVGAEVGFRMEETYWRFPVSEPLPLTCGDDIRYWLDECTTQK